MLVKIKLTKHAEENAGGMKVTYDPMADAMYIYFSNKKKSTRTEEVSEDFLVDYAGREMIGIEILDASRKLPKENLDSIRSAKNTTDKFSSI